MRKLFVLLLLAIISAKVATVIARGPSPIELDAFQYWRLSALVMQGDVLLLSEPIAYRTPIHPWFLALIRTFAGSRSLLAATVVHGLLAVAIIVIAGHIAARITKLPRAMLWTLLVSLPSVSALTFCATVLTETLFVFLLMLNLLAVLDYAKYSTLGRSIWLGVTFALTLLTRPIVLLLWIPHLIFLFYIHLRRRRRLGKNAPGRVKMPSRVLHALAAALSIGVLIAPWLARNHYLFGHPFITEFVGRNVWIVTFQDGSGAGLEFPATDAGDELRKRLKNVGVIEGWRHTWTVSSALVDSGLDDARTDRLMKQVAVDAIESNREAFAYKAFRRVVNYWRCAVTDLPAQGRAAGEFRGQHTWERNIPLVDWAIEYRCSQSVALNTLLTAILAVATAVLIVNYPTRPYGVWLAMIFGYFSIVTGILEIPAYRYRIVVEPLVALAIGSAIAVLLSRRRKPAKLASVT